jgi:glutamate--glyoxylate aminotransferase
MATVLQSVVHLRVPLSKRNGDVQERDQVKKLVAQDSEKDGKVLHPDLLNPRLLEAQYAVRGELYLRAEELKKQNKQIIYTNGEHCCWNMCRSPA